MQAATYVVSIHAGHDHRCSYLMGDGVTEASYPLWPDGVPFGQLERATCFEVGIAAPSGTDAAAMTELLTQQLERPRDLVARMDDGSFWPLRSRGSSLVFNFVPTATVQALLEGFAALSQSSRARA